jgi:hypothetical protein
LQLEALEDRYLPSGNVISGQVFLDANNNGRLDPGETLVAGSTIQLRNASGVVINSAVTDANGAYAFSVDNTINTAPTTLTRTAAVLSTPTDWTKGLSVNQFDPSQGTLTAVEIDNAGTFTSEIKVESLDNAPATITANDSGSLTLSGPGVAGLVTNTSTAKTFQATAFDGVIDFGGTSGHDFGPQTANGSNSITLTDAASLAAYTGNGSVNLSEFAHATSSASGAGNLIAQISTSASTQVSVIYHYIPSNALRPGKYTIVQVSQPPGLLEGLESSGGVVIPNSVGTDVIPVTLGNTDLPNNNFAELPPSALSGFVYLDPNNDGVKEPGEPGIGGVTVMLTGTNDLGTVNLTTTTAADGSYQFQNLRPGTYTLSETQPTGYLAGKNSLGSAGGTLGANQFSAITLGTGGSGVSYNFGELLAPRVSGFVYLDSNDSGAKDPGETGIAGVTVTLTGTNDQGTAVNLVQSTAGDGSYNFTDLRPGTYTVTETQPSGYLAGKNSLGSAGGTPGNNQFSAITLPSGTIGVNYNFAELLPAGVSGFVYVDGNDNGTKDPGETGVSGATVTLTGTNDQGTAVNQTQSTAGDGSYNFANLRPGSYTVSLTQPSGYFPGKNSLGSAGGTPGNNQFSGIALASGTAGVNYNFAELLPTSLSGFVYVDSNDNGVKDSGEAGVSGATVTLTGANDQGTTINQTQTTAGDGSYSFQGLRPGTYTVTLSQPAGYFQGKDAVGSAGGNAGNNQLSNVALSSGVNAVNYNFGELTPASLAGFVYLDSDNDGIKQDNESGIAGVTVTLTGTDDQGISVHVVQPTGSDGSYQFGGLRPGSYTISDTQPAKYSAGKLTLGSVGGNTGTNQFSGVGLGSGVNGVNYNFGELLPANATGVVYSASYTPQASFGPPPDMSILSKLQFLSSSGPGTVDPVVQGQATYVDGLYRTLLGRPVDPTGLVTWVQQLHSGVPRTQVVLAIMASPEYRGLEVDRLYMTFLHRTADAGGRAGWVNLLLSGVREADVARMIIASGEYQSAHADDTTYVTGLYADILGRSPSAGEIASWVQTLHSGASRDAVAQAFLFSAETYLHMIDGDYQHLLNRTPSSAEEQGWLAQLVSGQSTPESIVALFLASDEFYGDSQRGGQ